MKANRHYISYNLYILMFLISFGTFAQSQTDFGIKGGLNFTFFNVDEEDFGENPDSETGYYGGIF
ncbi:MAG: hypothetical protein HRU26_08145, partial [Psychroserpens sp.]|nr:hypothetical protein [Psychroserpens sp.]